jgi:hypothetical protein
VPLPDPVFEAERFTPVPGGLNVALTDRATSIVTVHWPEPEQAPPQPLNTDPPSASR